MRAVEPLILNGKGVEDLVAGDLRSSRGVFSVTPMATEPGGGKGSVWRLGERRCGENGGDSRGVVAFLDKEKSAICVCFVGEG